MEIVAIAKKQTFVNVDNIDGDQAEAEKKVLKGAALTEKKKSNAGRKKKSQEEKAEEMMAVYFTDSQKTKVQEYCDSIPIPFSTLVKQMLFEKGVLS